MRLTDGSCRRKTEADTQVRTMMIKLLFEPKIKHTINVFCVFKTLFAFCISDDQMLTVMIRDSVMILTNC